MTSRFAARLFCFLSILAVSLEGACSVAAHAASPFCASPAPRLAAQAEDTLRFVIHVSVDGLRADAVARLGPRNAPHFHRMRIEGAYTENARTDYDYTVTLPNHACELTGRPVLGPDGHGVSINSDDGRTLEQIHGSYVAGVFDVVHDHGLRTGMYASKSKFALFDRSWNGVNGAPDTTGDDDGRDKIDAYVYNSSTAPLIDTFIGNMTAARHHYSFIHLVDPDGAGHSSGWESKTYFDSVIKVDGLLGRIFDLVDGDSLLAARTWIVVVADHGGIETDHGDATKGANYTIPLYVWGPGVSAGADLYWLNPVKRTNPGSGRPDHAAWPQPIRNGEAANLSLDLLGLGPVPGSTFDVAQDNDAALPGGALALPSVAITNPAPGTILEYPSSVLIEATADPRGGAVTCVEFFANYVKLGEDATSPYAEAWDGAPLGTHRLTARVMRGDGVAAVASTNIEIVSTAGEPEGHSFLRVPPHIYPNPFDRLATVAFSLSRNEDVEITTYDLLGRRIERVFGGFLGEGVHMLSLNAAEYAPGLYFLKLRSGDVVRTGKLMIVR